MQLLAMCTRPFVMLLTFSTPPVGLLGVRQHTPKRRHRRRNPRHAGRRLGNRVIEQHQHEMVRNVFRRTTASWVR